MVCLHFLIHYVVFDCSKAHTRFSHSADFLRSPGLSGDVRCRSDWSAFYVTRLSGLSRSRHT